MDENNKKYSVSDLAEIIQVPRTTINDWLNRYAQYIDFQMQGKRRIYLDSSLVILREIAQLRATGLSSFEIEEVLAKNHPILAIPHSENQRQDNVNNPSNDNQIENTDSENTFAITSKEELSLIIQQQSEQWATTLHTQLNTFNEQFYQSINENRQLRSQNYRRQGIIFILLIFLLILGLGGSYWIFAMSKDLQTQQNTLTQLNQTLRLSEQQNTNLTESTTQLQQNLTQTQEIAKKTQEQIEQLLMEKEKTLQQLRNSQTKILQQQIDVEFTLQNKIKKLDETRQKQEANLKQLETQIKEKEKTQLRQNEELKQWMNLLNTQQSTIQELQKTLDSIKKENDSLRLKKEIDVADSAKKTISIQNSADSAKQNNDTPLK